MNAPIPQQKFSLRVLAVLALHELVFALAFVGAFLLRYDFDLSSIPEQRYPTVWLGLVGVLTIKPIIFYALGHCHGWWRYVTFSDLALLLKAAVVASFALFVLDSLMVVNNHIPRSILLLDWGLTIMLLGGMRCFFRMSREQFWPMLSRSGYRRALIVGANHAGESLARQLVSDPRMKYQIVGFLDQSAVLDGTRLAGIPVVGRPDAAASLATAFGIDEILVVADAMPGRQLRQLMTGCDEAGVALKVLPKFGDLLNHNYRVSIRDLDINDLLRRDPVALNSEAIGQLVSGKRVMVTGAGGSIGSEICRQVLNFAPEELILVEQSENSLFIIEQELLHVCAATRIVPCIADICDVQRLTGIFDSRQPEVVFHAAAHKHVPMMEHNPGEAIKNNVLGTKQLVEQAHRFGVSNFVMISTDKAVNPTSIMGVSKQLAERYVHAYSENSPTKFVVVRFGNVLGSNGSVVPIFREQIRRGGPITITHPDIERYFMTIPEASQLVLQAAAMGQGGEIFVLDMGEPVKIVELARDLIHLSGLTTDDIEIAFTGLRPGEKLFEELYFDNEETLPTQHAKVFVAYHRPFTLDEVAHAVQYVSAAADGPVEELRRRLKEVMPEYVAPGEEKSTEQVA